jgi:hypothetical protein
MIIHKDDNDLYYIDTVYTDFSDYFDRFFDLFDNYSDLFDWPLNTLI